MLTIDLSDGNVRVTASVPKNNFNKELLNKFFGITSDSKNQVISVRSSKDFNTLIPLIRDFIQVVNILKV